MDRSMPYCESVEACRNLGRISEIVDRIVL